ncbi:MAG: RNA-binding transcriptional accessory protein, partial [Euryarchaeota archaeon]|nr:RNA-binding transcriptional accessory protein [Euryarchaeota archaeon]
WRALRDRKAEVLRLLAEQGQLTPELETAIQEADNLQGVEDLYRPYRPKRRTRASVAKERGLEPLADALLPADAVWSVLQSMAAEKAAQAELENAGQALAGAADILAERVSDDPKTRARARALAQERATLTAECALPPERAEERTPYENYYGFSRRVRDLRPHAVLAIDRGEREEVLQARLQLPEEDIVRYIERSWVEAQDADVASFLNEMVLDAYKRLLAPSIEREIRRQLSESAGEHAIAVFARNLESLLMQPPVRGCKVLGIDPGFRTGCKVAAVDETGRLLATATIYPHPPQNRREEAGRLLQEMITTHDTQLVAIGNGTASRETEMLVAEVIRSFPAANYVIVNEAGASVYSASDLAREEFPDLDVSMRGAVSIARRIQDPLAELVKIEPKSIGVGQYQHDVDQKALAQALADVVESCVNRVGVNLNTASAALLQHVAGLNATLSRRIVAHRDSSGPFATRQELLEIKGLGPKTFEQAAGFLRIPDGTMPLDATAVHPESYALAEKILAAAGLSLSAVATGDALEACATLNPQEMATALGAGLPTVTDIIDALQRPGLDPRTELPPPPFRRDVLHMEDLRSGMRLTGTVTNVVDFGAFVDIG